ncbi:hypothetical protein [Thermostichus sp. MS-CIW-30]
MKTQTAQRTPFYRDLARQLPFWEGIPEQAQAAQGRKYNGKTS